jgi:hypothetical protein
MADRSQQAAEIFLGTDVFPNTSSIKVAVNEIGNALIQGMEKAYQKVNAQMTRKMATAENLIQFKINIADPTAEITRIQEQAVEKWKKGRLLIAADPTSLAEFSARELDTLSREDLYDPAKAEQLLNLSNALKLTVRDTANINLFTFDEREAIVAKTLHLEKSLQRTHRDITDEMYESLEAAQIMEKTEGKLSKEMLKRLLKASDEYKKHENLMIRINKSGEKDINRHKETIGIMDKMLIRQNKLLKQEEEMLKIGKLLDALKMGWAKNLLSAQGIATTVLGGLADSFSMMITTQERFHTVNYRMYHSIGETSNQIYAMARNTGLLTENIEKSYQAMMEVGAPKAAITELTEQNAKFVRTTGASADVVARFQKVLYATTGSTKSTRGAMAALIHQMKTVGLNARDVEEIMSMVEKNAVAFKTMFGKREIEEFSAVMIKSAAAAKQFGESTARAVMDTIGRVSTGALDQWDMMLYGADLMFMKPSEAITTMIMGAEDAKRQLEGLPYFMQLQLKDRAATIEVHRQMLKEAQAAARARGDVSKEAVERELKRINKNNEIKEKAEAESQRTLHMQFKKFTDALIRIGALLADPLEKLVGPIEWVIKGIETLVGGFDSATKGMGVFGSALKLLILGFITMKSMSLLYCNTIGKVFGSSGCVTNSFDGICKILGNKFKGLSSIVSGLFTKKAAGAAAGVSVKAAGAAAVGAKGAGGILASIGMLFKGGGGLFARLGSVLMGVFKVGVKFLGLSNPIGWVILALTLFHKEIWGIVKPLWDVVSKLLELAWSVVKIALMPLRFSLTLIAKLLQYFLAPVIKWFGGLIEKVSYAVKWWEDAMFDFMTEILVWTNRLTLGWKSADTIRAERAAEKAANANTKAIEENTNVMVGEEEIEEEPFKAIEGPEWLEQYRQLSSLDKAGREAEAQKLGFSDFNAWTDDINKKLEQEALRKTELYKTGEYDIRTGQKMTKEDKEKEIEKSRKKAIKTGVETKAKAETEVKAEAGIGFMDIAGAIIPGLGMSNLAAKIATSAKGQQDQIQMRKLPSSGNYLANEDGTYDNLPSWVHDNTTSSALATAAPATNTPNEPINAPLTTDTARPKITNEIDILTIIKNTLLGIDDKIDLRPLKDIAVTLGNQERSRSPSLAGLGVDANQWHNKV